MGNDDDRIVTLVSQLEAYGRHYEWCAVKDGRDCNCHFEVVLEQARMWRDTANERLSAEVAHHALTGE